MDKLAADSLMEVAKGLGFWGFAAISLTFIFILIYVYYRAKSAFFLTDRIWSFFSAEKNFHDPLIQMEWKKIRDVEAFIYRTRIHVRSTEEINFLINSAKKNGILFGDLIKIGRYFDAENFNLRKANYKIKLFSCLILFCIFYFLLLAPNLFFQNYSNAAYLYFKGSGQSFLLFEDKALLGDNKIDKNNCQNFSPKELDIRDGELDALCRALNSENKVTYHKNVEFQMASVFVWIMISCVGLLFSARRLISCANVLDYLKKSNKKTIFTKSENREKDEELLQSIYQSIDEDKK
jgi:hypothetical protein